MSALDKYSKCSLQRTDLQNAIFNHYITKYKSFVCENSKGSKRLFYIKQDFGYKSALKSERKTFRDFMNKVNKNHGKKRRKSKPS